MSASGKSQTNPNTRFSIIVSSEVIEPAHRSLSYQEQEQEQDIESLSANYKPFKSVLETKKLKTNAISEEISRFIKSSPRNLSLTRKEAKPHDSTNNTSPGSVGKDLDFISKCKKKKCCCHCNII